MMDGRGGQDESAADVTARCACGWEARGHVDEVVTATLEHARRVHNMESTRDEVLARLVGSTPEGG
jgi:predicted small metal-binding protein